MSVHSLCSHTSFVAASYIVGEQVGVVPIKGEIVSETVDTVFQTQIGARDLVKLIKEADEDPNVPVIFLDINSGGGSVVASKEIMRAVRDTNKPVVAYIGDVGASGAYYIASAADEIIADEDSLTGSIGVTATLMNYEELLNKVGVNVTVLKEGKYKTMGSPFEELTEEEKKIFQSIILDAYNDFKKDVLENRKGKLSEEELDEIADGRILNGRQALEYHLVDYVGSREFALKRAAKLGGIEGEPTEKIFTLRRNPLTGMFEQVGFYFGKGLLEGLRSRNLELRAIVGE